jgi:hypothetical protein
MYNASDPFFWASLFAQEHFLENAKLSENYFIANCEEMLVHSLSYNRICLYSFSMLLAKKIPLFLVVLYLGYIITWHLISFKMLDIRKLLRLLMYCPFHCMINTFLLSGKIFIPVNDKMVQMTAFT